MTQRVDSPVTVDGVGVCADGTPHVDADACRVGQEYLEMIGSRWTAGVLLAGLRGATRFSEYRALVEGISDRLLSVRLRELERDGWIERTVIPTTPVQVRYTLTPRAKGMLEAMAPLLRWSHRDRAERAEGPTAA